MALLNCTFLVQNTSQFNYSCSIKLHWKPKKQLDHCPTDVIERLGYAETGHCLLKCKEGECSMQSKEAILYSSRENTNGSEPWCRTINFRQHYKPGPVINLYTTKVTKTSCTVKWEKPHDLANYDESYIYTIDVTSGDGHQIATLVKRSKKSLMVKTVRRLQPWKSHKITVVSTSTKGGFKSDPVTIMTKTKEDVPVSGPLISNDSYSLQEYYSSAAVYWRVLPLDLARGNITGYVTSLDDETHSDYNRSVYWVTVNITNGKHIKFDIWAKNNAGRSQRPSTLNVDVSLEMSYITLVIVEDDYIKWTVRKNILVDKIRLHHCYGIQLLEWPQLLDCRTPIIHADIDDIALRQSLLPRTETSLIPDSLSCDGCRWQYAVSCFVGNSTTGMVWNTQNSLRDGAPILLAMTILVGVAVFIFVITVISCCRLQLYKECFYKYSVEMPNVDMSQDHIDVTTDDYDHVIMMSQTSKDSEDELFLRDSGHGTMLSKDINNDYNNEVSNENLLPGIVSINKKIGSGIVSDEPVSDSEKLELDSTDNEANPNVCDNVWSFCADDIVDDDYWFRIADEDTQNYLHEQSNHNDRQGSQIGLSSGCEFANPGDIILSSSPRDEYVRAHSSNPEYMCFF